MANMFDKGLYTGLSDCHGNPVHLGDTLEFDPNEWGNSDRNKFVIGFSDGELDCLGTPGDISEWCTIIKKWDK